MITTCTIRIITGTNQRQWQYSSAPTHPCGRPIDPAYYESGPWMCDECRAASTERARSVKSSFVPMAADVLRYMQDHGVDQDTAVRALGGTP